MKWQWQQIWWCNRFGGATNSATAQDPMWLMLPCAPASAKSQGMKASLKALQQETNSAPVRDFFPLFLGTCLWMMLSSLFIPMRTLMLANHSSVLPGSSLEMVLAHNSKMDDEVKEGNSESYTFWLSSSKLWLYPSGTWKILRGPVANRVLTPYFKAQLFLVISSAAK